MFSFLYLFCLGKYKLAPITSPPVCFSLIFIIPVLHHYKLYFIMKITINPKKKYIFAIRFWRSLYLRFRCELISKEHISVLYCWHWINPISWQNKYFLFKKIILLLLTQIVPRLKTTLLNLGQNGCHLAGLNKSRRSSCIYLVDDGHIRMDCQVFAPDHPRLGVIVLDLRRRN